MDLAGVETGGYLRIQQPPVGASPAVDALLDVAHYQAGTAGVHTVAEQGFEVVPLHPGGVLELVQQVVVQAGAHALVYKRCVAAVDDVRQEARGVRKQDQVVAAAVVPDLSLDVAQDTGHGKISQYLQGCEVLGEAVRVGGTADYLRKPGMICGGDVGGPGFGRGGAPSGRLFLRHADKCGRRGLVASGTQLVEIVHERAGTALEIRGYKIITAHYGRRLVRHPAALLAEVPNYLPHGLPALGYGSAPGQFNPGAAHRQLERFLEEFRAQTEQLGHAVPVTAVLHRLHGQVDEPLQQFLVVIYRAHQLVHSYG